MGTRIVQVIARAPKLAFVVAVLSGVVGLTSSANAAIDYGSAGGVYAQSFDALSATGTANAWANNSTIPGFYLFNSGATSGATGRTTGNFDDRAPSTWQAVTDYRSTGGSSSRFYAWGSATTNPGDRALGSLAGSTAASDPGDLLYALAFRNTTGARLDSFTLTYTGEQWFDQLAPASGVPVGTHKLEFSHLVKESFEPGADVPTQLGFGDYTRDERLTFASPVTGNTASQVTALDGNEAANRTTLSATIAVDWAPDRYLVLRFWDDDNDGNDQPMGIDDLAFSANATAVVPEPSALAIALVAAGAGLARRRHRRSQGGAR